MLASGLNKIVRCLVVEGFAAYPDRNVHSSQKLPPSGVSSV